MKYLIRLKGFQGTKIAAHLWDGNDTYCRMASTGGLKVDRFRLFDEPHQHSICTMCLVNAAKRNDNLPTSAGALAGLV